MNLETRISEITKQANMCSNFGELYTLSDEFRKIGLTIRECNSRRMILCIVRDGQPINETMGRDFIFIGSTNHEQEVIPPDLKRYMVEFIQQAASDAQLNEPEIHRWNGYYKLYDAPVTIVDEDTSSTLQDMGIQEHSNVESNLYEAVCEWLKGQ